MNGISSDACIGLIGVMVGSALGFLGSVIVIWVEGREKTRSWVLPPDLEQYSVICFEVVRVRSVLGNCWLGLDFRVGPLSPVSKIPGDSYSNIRKLSEGLRRLTGGWRGMREENLNLLLTGARK